MKKLINFIFIVSIAVFSASTFAGGLDYTLFGGATENDYRGEKNITSYANAGSSSYIRARDRYNGECGNRARLRSYESCPGVDLSNGGSSLNCGNREVNTTITIPASAVTRCYIRYDARNQSGRVNQYIKINQQVNWTSTPATGFQGANLNITTYVRAENTNGYVTGGALNYTSSTTSVCSVNGSGIVTYLSSGTCQITATTIEDDNVSGGQSASISWSVIGDSDSDGVFDNTDNCLNIQNADQANNDGDANGDACDDDDDNDGLNDGVDGYPFIDIRPCIPTPGDTDNDGRPDSDCNGMTGDLDDDADGQPDAFDNCPLIANPGQEDWNNNGVGNVCENSDSDAFMDDVDLCPGVSSTSNIIGVCLEEEPAGQEDGIYQLRPDGSVWDNCPTVFNPTQADDPILGTVGLGTACDPDEIDPNDTDADGITNNPANDNCPNLYNPLQENNDGDSEGDICDADDDNDGVADLVDNCPLDQNADQSNVDGDSLGDVCDNDLDGDGVAAGSDNCEFLFNPGQENADGDALGDACEPDTDNDGISDANGASDTDNCPNEYNPNQIDQDNDLIGDLCELDSDDDGISDSNGPNDTDNCPNTSNPSQEDLNFNGVGDDCEAVFVTTTGAGTQDCLSWDNACSDVRTAMLLAPSVNASYVFIAQGSYQVTTTLAVPAGITLAGGFAGNELRIDDSRPDLYETVLTGDSSGGKVVEIADKAGSNFARLIRINTASTDIDDTVTLKGLTLSAAGSLSAANGAGVSIQDSRVVLEDVKVYAMEALNGAGLTATGSSIVSISGSEFKNNASATKGGAIFVRDTTQLFLSDVKVRSNSATNGGGIYAQNTSVLNVEDIEIETNTASNIGGGVYLTSSAAQHQFKRSLFNANSADSHGGAIASLASAMLDIENVTIAKNTAGGDGGGLFLTAASGDVEVNYSTFAQNTAAVQGGGLYLSNGPQATLTRSLLVANTAATENDGSNIYLEAGGLTDGGFNLIGHDSASGVEPVAAFTPEADEFAAGYTGSYTTIETLDQILNVSLNYDGGDDALVSSKTKTMALQETSSARDVMNVVECGVVTDDQRGQNRQDDLTGMCDIGAYEYASLTCQQQTQQLRESGSFYLANCNPSNGFVFSFGNGLPSLGSLGYGALLAMFTLFGIRLRRRV